jgi:hypothetical protein
MNPTKNVVDRLLAMVSMEPNTGCWLWTGAVAPGTGYARIHAYGMNRNAHKVSYMELVGPVPDGLDLDHLCRVRCCVNPKHLEPVTHQVNCQRGNCGRPV